MILFRHADWRFPFLWESAEQPAGRWHGEGAGPAHYFADTPHGAWAEFLRHEEITEVEDLEGIRRALWAVDIPDSLDHQPRLESACLIGGPKTYSLCQAEANRLRTEGADGLRAPSAALLPGGAKGWIVAGGLKAAAERDGEVFVLFGIRQDLVGWAVTLEGRPPEEVLGRVRHFPGSVAAEADLHPPWIESDDE